MCAPGNAASSGTGVGNMGQMPFLFQLALSKENFFQKAEKCLVEILFSLRKRVQLMEPVRREDELESPNSYTGR